MYIGNNLQVANPSYKIIDDISSGFNGSTTSFALQVSGETPVPFPISTQQVMISVNGVVQEPDPSGSAGFKLLGSNIVFSSAPANGHAFFGTILAGADYVTAGSEFPDGSVTAPSFTFESDQDSGFYRIGSGDVGYSSNGVQILNYNGNGLNLPDNKKVQLGTSSDLEIFHNGSHSVIKESGTGALKVVTNSSFQVRNADEATGEYLINANVNGSAELYYNGLKSLYTDSLGVSVKGGDTSSKTQLSIFGNEGQRGVLQISADDGDDNADHWQFQARTDGNLNIQNLNSGSWGNSAVFVGGGAAMLYNNNVKVFETKSNGVIVQGTENQNAELLLYADEGDDNADKWKITSLASSSSFYLQNYSDGSWENSIYAGGGGAVKLSFDNSWRLETEDNGIYVYGPEGGVAHILLYADEGDDNADKWRIQSDTSGNFKVSNYSTGSWVDGLTLDGSNNATFAAGLTVDTNTLHVDATNNRVGIGTTSPSATLDLQGSANTDGVKIFGGSSGNNSPLKVGVTDGTEYFRVNHDGKVGIGTTSPASYYCDQLVVDIGSNVQSGITIVSETDKQGQLAFADGTSGDARYRGYIDYHHNTDRLSFGVIGQEALAIDSSRNATFAGTVSDSKGDLRKIPLQDESGGAYTLVATDAGQAVHCHSSTTAVTINPSVFAAGDAVTIVNGSTSSLTITQGTSFTLRNSADGTTGNRALGQFGVATVWFSGHNVGFISGAGLS